MRIHDVTVLISDLMPVWPGDPPVRIERVAERASGAPFNMSRLHLGRHTGTHDDAPFHLAQQGQTVDRLPLDVLVGSALVLDLEDLPGKSVPTGMSSAQNRGWRRSPGQGRGQLRLNNPTGGCRG